MSRMTTGREEVRYTMPPLSRLENSESLVAMSNLGLAIKSFDDIAMARGFKDARAAMGIPVRIMRVRVTVEEVA